MDAETRAELQRGYEARSLRTQAQSERHASRTYRARTRARLGCWQMNAPFSTPKDAKLVPEVDALLAYLAFLEHAQARKMIYDYWRAGWITGDCAMEALIECDRTSRHD